MSAALVRRSIPGRLVIRPAWDGRPVIAHAAHLLDGRIFARCGFVRPVRRAGHLWVRSPLVQVSCRRCLAAR